MIDVAGERLQVTGPMVIDTATVLKKAGDGAIAAGAVVVDLSGVTDADSAAVAILLSWVRAAQERKQALSIVNPPSSIRSLAALYGVAELLPLA
jgi:phospholipid transport system transporter-binding protein